MNEPTMERVRDETRAVTSWTFTIPDFWVQNQLNVRVACHRLFLQWVSQATQELEEIYGKGYRNP